MSPLRWDVLLLGFVLALPVLAMGLRGDLTAEEVAMRLPWCLAAAWGAVAVLRFAGTPRTTHEPAGRSRSVRPTSSTPRRRTASTPPPPDARPLRAFVLTGPADRSSTTFDPVASRPQVARRPPISAWLEPTCRPSSSAVTPTAPRRALGRRLARRRARPAGASRHPARLRTGGVVARASADVAATRSWCAATLAGLRRPAVVSHQSAAVLLGLPLWDVPARPRAHHPPTRACNDASGRPAPLPRRATRDDEVDGDRWAGQVTDPVRTALDLARSAAARGGGRRLDAALHGGS